MSARSFLVTVELPPGVGPALMRAYIREAVQVWCKTLEPGDRYHEGNPLFDLRASSVKVRLLPEDKPVH